jgi:hypothetical protein
MKKGSGGKLLIGGGIGLLLLALIAIYGGLPFNPLGEFIAAAPLAVVAVAVVVLGIFVSMWSG